MKITNGVAQWGAASYDDATQSQSGFWVSLDGGPAAHEAESACFPGIQQGSGPSRSDAGPLGRAGCHRRRSPGRTGRRGMHRVGWGFLSPGWNPHHGCGGGERLGGQKRLGAATHGTPGVRRRLAAAPPRKRQASGCRADPKATRGDARGGRVAAQPLEKPGAVPRRLRCKGTVHGPGFHHTARPADR